MSFCKCLSRFPATAQADVDVEATLDLPDVGCTLGPGAKGSALTTAVREREVTIRSLHSTIRVIVQKL